MWFCGMFKAGSRAEVSEGLTDRGYQVYVPMERKFIVHARRRLEVERPMLGRYFFVGAVAGQDPGPIYGVRGLDLILGDAQGRPVVVPDHEVERMITRQDAGEFDKTRNIQAGDRVMITQHWFAVFIGQMATVKKVKGMHSAAGGVVTAQLDSGVRLEISEYSVKTEAEMT